MPGICGIVSCVPDTDIGRDLHKMADAISHFSWYARETFVAPAADFAVVRAHLNALPAAPNDNGRLVWLHGEPNDGFTRIECDGASGAVTIRNDRLGMMPVFYSQTN